MYSKIWKYPKSENLSDPSVSDKVYRNVYCNVTNATYITVARIPAPWVTIYLDTSTTADKQLTSPLADDASNCILMALSSRRLCYYTVITRQRFTTQGDNVLSPHPPPFVTGNVVLSGGGGGAGGSFCSFNVIPTLKQIQKKFY
jgi:hypothetical protein